MIEYLSPVADTRFPEHWYEFADGDHFWMQWRLAVTLVLLEQLGLPRDGPLLALDIGGGSGGFRGQIESHTRWRADLTDLSLAALRLAPPARGRTLYYDVTQPDPRLVGSYDVCFLFDVIEHVPRPGELLRASLAHLRPGGHLIVNVPALGWLFGAYDVAAGHLRRYSRRALASELAGLALHPVSIRYWGMSLVPLLAWRRWAGAGRSPAHTIRWGFEPPNSLAHRALSGLMRVELAVLKNPPIGTSLMAGVRRPEA